MTTEQIVEDRELPEPLPSIEADPGEEFAAQLTAEIDQLNRGEGVEGITPPDELAPAPAPSAPLPATPAAVAPAPSIPSSPIPEATATTPDATRIVELERQNDAYQEQIAQAELAREAAQYQQTLIDQGQDDSTASNIATQHYQTRMQAWESYKTNQTLRSTYEGQFNDTIDVAEKYGIPAKSLSHLGTREAKIIEAQRLKETREMKKQISQLQQAQVPSQTLDSGLSEGSGTTDEHLVDQYNAGNVTPATTAAMKRLTGL